MVQGVLRLRDADCGTGAAEGRAETERCVKELLRTLVGEAGFEPTTLGFGGQYSIQLSYPPCVTTMLLCSRPRLRRAFLTYWRAEQDSNLRPLASKANALSS